VLAALVAEEILELQVAVLRETDMATAKGRIFHDKLGIFRDEIGNAVIFKDSQPMEILSQSMSLQRGWALETLRGFEMRRPISPSYGRMTIRRLVSGRSPQ
jgi:hypothetical protein